MQYSVCEGVPGVSVHRRNVVWTPVVPSPVATRTRSRTKDNLCYANYTIVNKVHLRLAFGYLCVHAIWLKLL